MKNYYATVFVLIILSLFMTGCFDSKKEVVSSGLIIEQSIEGTVIKANENFYGVELISNSVINEDDIKYSNNNIGILKNTQGKTIISVAASKGMIKKNDTILVVSNSAAVSNLTISTKTAISPETATKRVPVLTGDFNSDGFVNLSDFGIFKIAYKEPTTSTKYNSKCDIAPIGSPDNKIDIIDFVIFANNYGKSVVITTITSVAITLAPTKELYIGDPFRFYGQANYSDGSSNTEIDWVSSNPAVAEIGYDGSITSKSEGTTQITASKVGTNGTKVSSTPFTLTIIKQVTSMRFYVESTAAASIYAWTGSGTSVVKLCGDWPGKAMTKGTDGYYYYDFAEVKNINVIFISTDFAGGKTGDLSRGQTGYYDKRDGSFKWWDKDKNTPVEPILNVSPAGGYFKTTLDITLNVSFDAKSTAKDIKYTLDGSDAKLNGITFTNGTKLNIGSDMVENDTKTLKVYVSATNTATGELLEKSAQYIFTKGTMPQSPFSWDNATVYFVLTDRFENGDITNDHSYGRECDMDGNPLPEDYTNRPGTFNGGDIKGLIKKLDEGYFTNLGVNAIWMSSPVEQIHGWVTGGPGPFKHYGYHGYYAFDFTEVDKNMGTYEELKTFIDKAHEKGIRIIFDTVINHAGYETIADIKEFGFGGLNAGYEAYFTAKDSDANYDSFIKPKINFQSPDWSKWWGPTWVRKNEIAGGYDPMGSSGELGSFNFNLPDFKTESTAEVGIPDFLVRKWGGTSGAKYIQEKKELDEFFSKTGRPRTVRNYVIKWLTDYVRELGVDGFRLDTVNNIEIASAKELSIEGHRALKEWKAANPTKKLDDLEFWMTGEAYDYNGISGSKHYFSNGFDSMINFAFPKDGNTGSIGNTWKGYAEAINSSFSFNTLSYISSHDKGLSRGNMIGLGTCLMLAPGGIQIFYGDENGRPASVGGEPGWRSRIKFGDNPDILTHWQKLGQFRYRHLSVGGGTQTDLGDSTYGRKYDRNGMSDVCVIKLNATGSTAVNVAGFFADGTSVKDGYTGAITTVTGGKATFTADSNGVILVEANP